MWKQSLNPYIKVFNSGSPAFLPLIIDIPNTVTSIHVAVYLPTAGKEAEYLAALANLKANLEELIVKYPSSPFFIRGDENSSK